MTVRLKPVSEQVIVITGASSGIGLATAREAAGRGARVVMNSRDGVDLERAAHDIRTAGGRVVYDVGDVGDLDAMERLAALAVREFGAFDTWVNNAGVSIYGMIADVPLEDAHRLFRTNYWGVVHGSLVAAAHFRRRGMRDGSGCALINVGSILSETGYPLQGYYAASKHAVKGFTDSLRLDLQKEAVPVSVSLVEPGPIDTPFPAHAGNYLGVEPTHMPPVYAPEVVADAILECARHPHRTLLVGGGAKMLAMMEKYAPGLADRQKMAAFEQQRTDEPARDDATLWEPRPGDGRIHGGYPGHVMQSSAYTAMAKRPAGTAGAVLGLAAVGLGIGFALGAFGAERAD